MDPKDEKQVEPGKVKDLAEERQKRARKEKPDKMQQSELFMRLVASMNGEKALVPSEWPAFPRRFHLIEDEAGRKCVVEEFEGRVVAYRTVDYVTETIVRYCHEDLDMVDGADISYKAADNCRLLWKSLTPPLRESPLALAERSTPGLAFNRMPFDGVVEQDPDGGIVWPGEPPPQFEKFLARCSQPHAVAAFIGSLFFPEADRQQYLYLYGTGQDGKGSLLRFLYDLLKGACQATQPPTRGDKFWNMRIFGKRLVMFADCEAPEYFASPDFKSLTGNDPLYFEEKGKMGFTAIPSCKIIVGSNHKPQITSQKSDLRRLIFVKVTSIPDSELVPNFEQTLLSEAPRIVAWCKAMYLVECPGHRPIPCKLAEEVAAESEERFTVIFEKYFEKGERHHTAPASYVQQVLRSEGIRSNGEIRKVKAAWERIYGVLAEKATAGQRVYTGLKRKHMSEVGL